MTNKKSSTPHLVPTSRAGHGISHLDEVWKPHATVAAVIERDGQFLMVEEEINGSLVFNQPAGHLNDGESLVEAVVRETLEETAWHFEPDGVLGIYLWKHPDNGNSFLRVAFLGKCTEEETDQPLDEGIIRAVWLSHEELDARQNRLRSPLVLQNVKDYLNGERYPLDILSTL